MHQILICDSTKTFAKQAELYVSKMYHGLLKTAVYRNTMALLMAIEDTYHGDVDACFVDYDVLDDEEMSTLLSIKQKFRHIQIVFYGGEINGKLSRVFLASPIDFLDKPIEEEAFNKAIERILHTARQKRMEGICISNTKVIYRILYDDIEYLESQKKIVKIHTTYDVIEVRDTLDNVNEKLSADFLRCHQSYIVNMNRIRQFNKNGAVLLGEEIIPVSRPRYTQARKQYLEFLHKNDV